jgi:UrcA family protein
MNRSDLTVRIVAVALSVVGSALQLGIVGAALALSVASATAAVAAPSQAVRYDDLDLARPAGAAVLYDRIQHAARQVCGDAQRVGSRVVSPAWRVCMAGAVDRAVRAVDRPALSAYHAARTGVPRLIRTAALAAPHGRE